MGSAAYLLKELSQDEHQNLISWNNVVAEHKSEISEVELELLGILLKRFRQEFGSKIRRAVNPVEIKVIYGRCIKNIHARHLGFCRVTPFFNIYYARGRFYTHSDESGMISRKKAYGKVSWYRSLERELTKMETLNLLRNSEFIALVMTGVRRT